MLSLPPGRRLAAASARRDRNFPSACWTLWCPRACRFEGGVRHTLAIVQGGLVYSCVNDEDVGGGEQRGPGRNPRRTRSRRRTCPPGLAAVVTADGAIMGWGTFRTSSGLYAFTPEGEQISGTPKRGRPDRTPDARRRRGGTDHVLVLTKLGTCTPSVAAKGRLGLAGRRWTRTTSTRRRGGGRRL